MTWLVNLLVIAGVGGGIGYLIGNVKGRRDEGLWLGLLLGPIGWIIAISLQEKKSGPAARIARRGGEWPMGTFRAQPSGVKLRCPNCGEEGYVPGISDVADIVCPTCQQKFEAEKNLAKS